MMVDTIRFSVIRGKVQNEGMSVTVKPKLNKEHIKMVL